MKIQRNDLLKVHLKTDENVFLYGLRSPEAYTITYQHLPIFSADPRI